MNNEDLKKLWQSATSAWAGQGAEWQHIEAAYSASGRHYHTLQHLCEVYGVLTAHYGEQIPVSSVLALFYHDLIYNTLTGDNEKKSADYAHQKLITWGADKGIADKVHAIILATATHESGDAETMLFLDADMAILGAETDDYKTYIASVRKEYSIYPDILYRPGRRKFVEATLKRNFIFLTEPFRKGYEERARINLSNELKQLI